MPRKLIPLLVGAQILLLGCAGHQKPPTPSPKTPEKELSVKELTELCNGLGVHAECYTDTIATYWSMVAEFKDQPAFERNAARVTKDVGIPFCLAVHKSGLAARFYLRIVDVGHKALDCEKAEWGDWASEIALPIPNDLPPDKMCKFIEDDPAEPFHCDLAKANGMWKVTLKLTKAFAAAKAQVEKVGDQIGDQFCKAVLKIGDGGLVEFQMTKEGTGFRYNCETRKVSQPFTLPGAKPAARPSAPAPPPASRASSTTVL